MNQLNDFLNKLFETNDWPPRWFCGKWTDFHGWLFISSDIAIWLAYFIIPVIIILFIQNKPEVPFLPVFWLFGAFIILCGTTHLIDAVIFWWPCYRLSALVKFLTAIVSFFTVFALVRDLPKALSLQPKTDNSETERELRRQIQEKNQRITTLEKQLEDKKS